MSILELVRLSIAISLWQRLFFYFVSALILLLLLWLLRLIVYKIAMDIITLVNSWQSQKLDRTRRRAGMIMTLAPHYEEYQKGEELLRQIERGKNLPELDQAYLIQLCAGAARSLKLLAGQLEDKAVRLITGE